MASQNVVVKESKLQCVISKKLLIVSNNIILIYGFRQIKIKSEYKSLVS